MITDSSYAVNERLVLRARLKMNRLPAMSDGRLELANLLERYLVACQLATGPVRARSFDWEPRARERARRLAAAVQGESLLDEGEAA